MKIVSVKNLTTDEDLLKAAKTFEFEIVEIGTHNIIFDVPHIQKKFYANLLLKGVIAMKGEEVPFQFIGKVTSNETLEHATRLCIDLLQYDKQLWVQFIQQGKDKQERADLIFRSIKGDD